MELVMPHLRCCAAVAARASVSALPPRGFSAIGLAPDGAHPLLLTSAGIHKGVWSVVSGWRGALPGLWSLTEGYRGTCWAVGTERPGSSLEPGKERGDPGRSTPCSLGSRVEVRISGLRGCSAAAGRGGGQGAEGWHSSTAPRRAEGHKEGPLGGP